MHRPPPVPEAEAPEAEAPEPGVGVGASVNTAVTGGARPGGARARPSPGHSDDSPWPGGSNCRGIFIMRPVPTILQFIFLRDIIYGVDYVKVSRRKRRPGK